MLASAPVRFDGTARQVVRDGLALRVRHAHDGALDGEELVGEPGLVRDFCLPRERLLVGPEADQMDRADAEQHDDDGSRRQAVETGAQRPQDAHAAQPRETSAAKR